MTAKNRASAQAAPDQIPLTQSQANMLSSLTGIDASKFKGLTVAEIASQYRWQINPDFFLFVQICGQVVYQNPVTGAQYPIPYATVSAEETICSYLGFFPLELPWGWFFPFDCQTVTVGQTTTDGCGNFCLWVPRFEIEWILRFRLERICYIDLFTRPTVGSILTYLQGEPASATASPTALETGTALYAKVEQLLGARVAQRLAAFGANNSFGSVNTGQPGLLARSAFLNPLPPALPAEFRKPSNLNAAAQRSAVRSTLANKLGLDANELAGLDLGNYFGPYLRCIDILIPEWVPIFEVPDISLNVTQNVGGTTQVIYSGPPFDVPWSVEGVSNLTLVSTSPLASSTVACNTPDVPCGDVPSLEFVGLMPLVNPPLPTAPYINAVTGYATRPNAPHPGGTLTEAGVPPAAAPYTGTLQLYGCTQVDGAVYYRMQFTYTAPGSSTTSALAPFTGLSWPIYQESGGVLSEQWPVSDSNGWYPLPPAGWFPESLLLEWDTMYSTFNANGTYTIQVDVADGSKATLASSAPIAFVIDNSLPAVTWNASWSFNSDMSGAQPLPTTGCVVIDRGSDPQDVYVQLNYTVTANNLRQVQVGTSGCAGGATATSVLSTLQHWYEDAADNTVTNTATFVIASTQPAGAYSFGIYADTRAFNPAGDDSGPLDDWNYNPPAYWYRWTDPSFTVAVVNEDE
jgi:hypothetical protein